MADFGFVGGAYEAPSIYQDAQQLINWYCEVDHEKEDAAYYEQLGEAKTRGVVALYPTPGFGSPIAQPASGEVRGMYTLADGTLLFFVIGTTAYKMDTLNAVTAIGTLTTGSGAVDIVDNSLHVMIVDGVNRYAYILASGTFSTIASTDGPWSGGVTLAAVDNYIVYNQPGNSQQFAATNSLSTTTPALSFASKFGGPDPLLSIVATSRDLFLLGANTTEPWIDVGVFPFPFQIIPGGNSEHGCIAPHSPARFGETFAFLSRDNRGQGIVRQMTGYIPMRISTHAVEHSLVGKVITDAIGFTYQYDGHEFYVLTFPTADLTWVYDDTAKKWHKWLSQDAYGNFHRHRANCSALFNNQVLIGDRDNGGIYVLDNSVYTENGTPIRRVRQAPHLVSDFKRIAYSQLQIQFQPGVGLDGTGQGTTPRAMLKWSDDGGSTFGNEHWTGIGAIGQYKNRAIWRRMGTARDRIFHVSITDPVRAVIISADLTAYSGSF